MGSRNAAQQHRRGRLSLPSIRISSPTPGSPLSASVNANGSSSSSSYDHGAPLASSGYHHLHVGRSPLSQSVPLSSGASSDGSNRKRGTPSSAENDRSRNQGSSNYYRSSRDVRNRSSNASSSRQGAPAAAPAPAGRNGATSIDDDHDDDDEVVLPPEIREAMLASVAKCKDYEFLCNNLEKSIGHKITEFQAALDNYDKQDAVAINLQQSIALTRNTLESVSAAVAFANSDTAAVKSSLKQSQESLASAKLNIEDSKVVMEKLHILIQRLHRELSHAKRTRLVLLWTLSLLALCLAVFVAWKRKHA